MSRFLKIGEALAELVFAGCEVSVGETNGHRHLVVDGVSISMFRDGATYRVKQDYIDKALSRRANA